MHYIICGKCGHYNEVKSEYQIFCTACNKRLENNFTSWKSRNPDKSFENFKEIICTTQDPRDTLNKPTTAKGLKYWITTTVAFALLFAAAQLGGEKIASLLRKPSFDKEMMAVASEINQSCPIMVDSETRLDNVVSMPNKVLQYNYTLINKSKEDINIEVMESELARNIPNYIRTNPSMKTLRDFKTTFIYFYRDKEGDYLLSIEVKPEHYL
jgi:hypothetical protein